MWPSSVFFGAQELPPRGNVVEQVAHRNARAGSQRFFPNVAHAAAVNFHDDADIPTFELGFEQ